MTGAADLGAAFVLGPLLVGGLHPRLGNGYVLALAGLIAVAWRGRSCRAWLVRLVALVILAVLGRRLVDNLLIDP